jgi:hypothetical protein
VLHAPAWELNPALNSEGWKESKRRLLGVDGFNQEHGAEFTSGAGQFFAVQEIVFEDSPARPEDGREWIAGFDPAFHADRFGVALVGESVAERGVQLVGVVDAIEPGGRVRSLQSRRAREDRVLERVHELIAPYSPRIVTDQHQADTIVSFFGRRGLSVRTVSLTGPIQTAAFVSTRTRLLDGSLRVWRHPVMVEDLRRVRARDATEAIVLPRHSGGHCDAVSALALATFEQRYVSDSPPGDVRGGRLAGYPFERELSPAGDPAGLSRRWNVDRAGYQTPTPPPGWWGDDSILTKRF